MRHSMVGVLLLAFTLVPAIASAQAPAEAPAQQSTAASVQASPRAHSQNGFSLGLILGDPTGLTLRGGLDNHNAIQAHFGYSPFPGNGLVAIVDWTYDAWDFLRNNQTAALLFYFGFGAKVEWFTGNNFYYNYHDNHSLPDNSHFGLGARGLVGLRASFKKAPFDVFFELAPLGVIVVVPDPAAFYDFDVGLGFRYRF